MTEFHLQIMEHGFTQTFMLLIILANFITGISFLPKNKSVTILHAYITILGGTDFAQRVL